MTPFEKLIRYASFLGSDLEVMYRNGNYRIITAYLISHDAELDLCIVRQLEELEPLVRERSAEISHALTS